MQTTLGAPISPAKRSYHLTPEQIRFFDENGYLVLKGRISGDLLRRAQQAGDRWIGQAQASGPLKPGTHFRFAKRPDGRAVPYRVDYIHDKGEPASLELLGSPEVLGIAESLSGPNFVPTYEAMVFKMTGDGELVPWHQDAVFPQRRFRVYNIDIYLDRALRDGGALRVIPKSQTAIHNVCSMNDGNYDWVGGAHETVELEPGDILVHDTMVLHGSPRALENPLRRTIYLEFRALEQILEEGPWDATFADQRLRLIPIALKRHRDAFPASPQFTWNVDPIHRPNGSSDEVGELKIAHTTGTPGSYCSASSQ